ncbi:hypothetical protein KKA33_00780 [Patescibacteria group bacterium]|nr:hypothetical protein [Patescibacteria group bacterium]
MLKKHIHLSNSEARKIGLKALQEEDVMKLVIACVQCRQDIRNVIENVQSDDLLGTQVANIFLRDFEEMRATAPDLYPNDWEDREKIKEMLEASRLPALQSIEGAGEQYEEGKKVILSENPDILEDIDDIKRRLKIAIALKEGRRFRASKDINDSKRGKILTVKTASTGKIGFLGAPIIEHEIIYADAEILAKSELEAAVVVFLKTLLNAFVIIGDENFSRDFRKRHNIPNPDLNDILPDKI